MIGVLADVIWAATLIAGLALAVRWRTRLGRRAAPAVAGFAALLVVTAVNLLWDPSPDAPASRGSLDILAAHRPVDLAIMLALYAAYPLGLALLLASVLRRESSQKA